MMDRVDTAEATTAPTYEALHMENTKLRREMRSRYLLLVVVSAVILTALYVQYKNVKLNEELDALLAKNDELHKQLDEKEVSDARGPVGKENMASLKKRAESLIERPDPRSPSIGYSLRAYIHACNRDFDAAREDLAAARRIDGKKYTRPYYYLKTLLAMLHYELHDVVTEEMEVLLADFPNDPETLKIGAMYFGFSTKDSVRDVKRATLLMERLIEERGNVCHRDEFLIYAHLLAGEGRHADALPIFKKALLMKSASPSTEERENKTIQDVIDKLEKGTYTPPTINSPLQVL